MKQGTPTDRAAAARYAHMLRAAGWPRTYVFIETRNELARMTARRRLAAVIPQAQEDARQIVAQPMFSEKQLISADLAEPSAMVKANRDAERAQERELSRQPNQGYLA